MDAAAPSRSTLPESLRGFASPTPAPAIQKINYTHDAMIDLIIASPAINQDAIAKHFGYTAGWVSQVFSSDTFQARLAERKDELVDPTIRATIEERLKAIAYQSLDVLRQKLEAGTKASDELVLRAAEITAKALGYGAKQTSVHVTQSFVVSLPQKAPNTRDWQEEHDPNLARQPRVLEASATTLPALTVEPTDKQVLVAACAPSAPAEPDPLQQLLDECMAK
jgi:hypothetical protein